MKVVFDIIFTLSESVFDCCISRGCEGVRVWGCGGVGG